MSSICVASVDGTRSRTVTRAAIARSALLETGGVPEQAAFPLVRLVGLVECGTHAIFDAAMLDTPRIDDAFKDQQPFLVSMPAGNGKRGSVSWLPS